MKPSLDLQCLCEVNTEMQVVQHSCTTLTSLPYWHIYSQFSAAACFCFGLSSFCQKQGKQMQDVL